MPADPRLLPTQYVLSDYRIVRVLGQGGFGITYLATDQNLGRQVAIKEYFPREYASRDATLTVRAAGNDEDCETFRLGLKWFLQEAQVLARFDHPNIIAVRRFFKANGTAYLVMDYCEGKPLDEIIRQSGPLDRWQLNKIFFPMLNALEELHKANTLHRDIKPANIFIRSDGSPVLLDFGAARQEVGAGHSRSLTSLATQHYAAIEQYSTRGQGPYTDIYSLGATLYRAASGEKPQDSADRILDDKMVPLVNLVGWQFDERILLAIDAAMAIRPEKRPQTVADWRDRLRGFEIENEEISDSTLPNTQPESTDGWKGPEADDYESREPHRAPPDLESLPSSFWVVVGLSIFGLAIGWLVYGLAQSSQDPTPVEPVTPGGKVLQDCIDCPRMVLVPAGIFLMGSPENEPGSEDDERPQHEVLIASSFYVGQYEVTINEWNACVQDKGCVPISPSEQVQDQLPITNVSWFDAQAYVVWLSKKSGNTYRLLSEAEWEFAARASNKDSYSFGNDAKKLGNFAWYQGNSTGNLQQVGLKKPNQTGLYDMHGNAMEWTQDCWSQNFEGAPSDGKASIGGDCTRRVARGGTYADDPRSLRSAYRNVALASDRYEGLGFRVAMSN